MQIIKVIQIQIINNYKIKTKINKTVIIKCTIKVIMKVKIQKVKMDF